MIELTVAAATEPELFWGMPLTALVALIALISAVATAVITGLVKKFRTPADNREDRVVVLEASDRLIQRFEKLLAESDLKHGREIADLAKEVEDLKQEVDILRRERYTLVSALMRVAQIARKYGGIDAEVEINNVQLPDGIILR